MDATSTSRRPAPILAGTLAALFCVSVAGGYGLGWSWTGFAGNDTLWEWLQLFVLPVTITLLPLWYRTRRRFAIEWRGLGLAAAIVAAVLLIGGYRLGWTWTGFAGRTLWDWLELLVLPGVLVALPILLTDARHDRLWRVGLAVLGLAFAGCALGGYLLDWDWTGFQGNTLWDWLHLFLVPFALPAAVIWFSFAERPD